MKTILTITLLLFTQILMAQDNNFHEISFVDIDGNNVKMDRFKGKKVLLINVASECGFTKQYKDLQSLHEQFGEDLILIGFPCDQFGGQEPGTEEEIKSFCQKNYGVNFLMASKIDVKGDNQHALYAWLTNKDKNGVESSSVAWNFEKYLVDENGVYLDHFKSAVSPVSDKITKKLQ